MRTAEIETHVNARLQFLKQGTVDRRPEMPSCREKIENIAYLASGKFEAIGTLGSREYYTKEQVMAW